MGDPQTPGPCQPHLPGRAVLGSPGRGTGLISVTPPRGASRRLQPSEPRAFDSSISCGRFTPWAFSISAASPPSPRVAGRASPFPQRSLQARGISARLRMPGRALCVDRN